MEDNPYQRILTALAKAERSKPDLQRVTQIPYGPLGHALEVLTIEGKVIKEGLRYKLAKPKEVNGHALSYIPRNHHPGEWGRKPHAR